MKSEPKAYVPKAKSPHMIMRKNRPILFNFDPLVCVIFEKYALARYNATIAAKKVTIKHKGTPRTKGIIENEDTLKIIGKIKIARIAGISKVLKYASNVTLAKSSSERGKIAIG